MKEILGRKYLISLSYMFIVLVGVIAWLNIPVEMAPDLRLPSVTVSYTLGSTSPEVMEQEVTRRVEAVATRLRNVEQIRSVSQEGRSSVTITFEKNVPVEYRILELREYLFGLQDDFPPQIRQPQITRSIPQELQDQETFMAYSISGDRSKRELYQFANEQIRLQLLGHEGLSDIEVIGAEDPVINIHFDSYHAELYGIRPAEVMRQVSERLSWRSAGFSEENSNRLSILIPPQYHSVEEIGTMPIPLTESSRYIQLRDVATVSIEDYPVKTLKRLNGKPALNILFLRESGSDAMKLAEVLRGEMERIATLLPSDITLQLERDSTEDLRAQFGDLQYQSAFSLLFVFLILIIFIRRLRAPFIIMGSILFSLLMSLSILFFIDYTLNVLTLAGITVALGMIIDNAVVVFEQVNPGLPRDRSDRIQHVRNELPNALVPVIGSTLTTVAIFIPLFFAMEELQLFLFPLAIALTLTLLSSVVISLTWIPYSLVWLVPYSEKTEKTRTFKERTERVIHRIFFYFFYYRHKMRWVVYLILIVVIGIPFFAITEPDWEETKWPEFTKIYFDNRSEIDPIVGGLTYRFFNEVYFGTPWGGQQQERILITIRTPQGTPLDEIDKMVRDYERLALPYAEAFEYFEADLSEYSGARLLFYINEEYLWRSEPYRFYNEAIFLATRIGNSGISVSGLGDGFSTGLGGGISGQRITLRGFSYDELLTLAEDISSRLRRNQRVRDVDIHTVGWGSSDMSHYVLRLDEAEIAQKGLSRGEILQAIQLDVNPTNSSGLAELDSEKFYLFSSNTVQTRYQEDFMDRARLADGNMFKMSELATLSRERTMSQIIRQNQSYSRTISVDFLGPPRLATNYIESVLEEVPVPVGASIQYGSGFFSWGESEQYLNYLLIFALTVLSVWMVVSALLESWGDPLVVILVIPLGLVGVMLGALYHNINFDQGAMAGSLLTIGVVVNNSILLIHEKQRCREMGIKGLRSWLMVYKNKMRTVMITSLTTIGGLVPLILFGTNEFWTDLAVVVIWGLATSLLLILLLMGIWEKKLFLHPSNER